MNKSHEIYTLDDGFKVFWTIRDFIHCKNKNKLRLRSSNFKVNMLRNSEWHMRVEVGEGKFGVFIFKDNGSSLSTIAHVSIYLLEEKGRLVKKYDFTKKFIAGGPGQGFDSFHFNELTNGALTVCFHLCNGETKGETAQCVLNSKILHKKEILHSPSQNFTYLRTRDLIDALIRQISAVKTSNKCVQTETNDIPDDFKDHEDLLRLYREKKFQYVILRAKDKEFAAHKALLCARSPVFNAMFHRDMRENDRNVVDIEDIDGDTLSLLCNFLHLEPLKDLKWDSAVKLFYAADKYQIDKLKDKCTLTMKKDLAENNICEAFVLADKYQSKDLMQSSLEFFYKNSKRIIGLPEWKDLIKTSADLAFYILSKSVANSSS